MLSEIELFYVKLAMQARKLLSIILMLSAIWLIVFQYSRSTSRTPLVPQREQWRPSLAWIDTIDKAMPVVTSYIKSQRGSHDEKVVKGVDEFVRDRFVHGISHTSWRENWALAALGGAPPYGLSVPIGADSILRHRHAMCSQQSIIFMELLHRFNMHYAAVRFVWPNAEPAGRGHFAVAAKVDGYWRYYDSDLEAANAPLIRDILNGSAAPDTYPGNPWWVPKMQYAAKHGGIVVDSFDTHPGPRGLLFQKITVIFSDFTPVIILLIALLNWPGVISKLRDKLLNQKKIVEGVDVLKKLSSVVD
jgi:hypothetical protein